MKLAPSNRITEKEKDEITLKASMLPGSTITGVEVIEGFDTWAVEIGEDRRPSRILIGTESQHKFTPAMWGALTMHEAAHSSATFYTASSIDWPKKLAHSITNILEDARIEHDLEKEYPGYVPSFRSLNDFCFDEFRKGSATKGSTIQINDWQDVFEGLLAKKLGRYQDASIEVVKPTQDIELPNGTTRQLGLAEMVKDAEAMMTDYEGQPSAFFEPERIRRSNNRFAVNRLNSFLDKYGWLARNESEKAKKLGDRLADLIKDLGLAADLKNKTPQGPGHPEEGKEKVPGQNPDQSHLEEVSRDKTQKEQEQELKELLEEMKPNPGAKSYDARTLASLYRDPRVRELLAEVNKYFPVGKPSGKGYRFEQTTRKRFRANDGDLEMDAVINYMAANRPKGMLLARDSVAQKKASGELHHPPPGNTFPIKRIAIYLDLSGSMHDKVADMIAFSAAFSMFARKHKVDTMFVVGDQGAGIVHKGNPTDMHRILTMKMGNSSNNPTWTPASMQEAYHWAKDKGRIIFITDRAIKGEEVNFIDKILRAKAGISVYDINVKELADVLWMRRPSDIKDIRDVKTAQPQISQDIE